MKAKLSFLYLLLLLPCTFYAQTNPNSGTEFVFSFMESGRFGGPISNVNHSILLTSETDATAIIKIMNSNVWVDIVQIVAFQAVRVQIPAIATNVFYTEGSDIINPTGALQITSDFPITVNALSQSNNATDASYISPLTSLGTSTQYRVMANYPSNLFDGYSSFLIVATHDNTMITINPSVAVADRPNINTSGSLAHASGTAYTITLNKGESYQAPFYQAVNYQYRVLATEDNTTVNISGVTGSIVLNAGQYFTGDANNETRYISADKKVAVAQFMKSGASNGAGTGDPAMLMISPQNQTVNSFTYATTDFNTSQASTHAVTIVVPSTGTNTVYLDNVLLPSSDFQAFSALPTYSYAIEEVSIGGHTISSLEGIIVYAYGLKPAESYSFSSGFSNRNNMLADFTRSNMRVNLGTSIDFSGTGMGVTNYAWDFGDGNTANGQTQTHLYSTPSIYEVCMAYTHPSNICGDSICKFVEVVDVNTFLEDMTYICDSDILLDPYPGNDAHINTYEWSKDGVIIPAPEGTADTLRVSDTELGEYTVTITTSTGFVTQDITNIEIAPATDVATVLT